MFGIGHLSHSTGQGWAAATPTGAGTPQASLLHTPVPHPVGGATSSTAPAAPIPATPAPAPAPARAPATEVVTMLTASALEAERARIQGLILAHGAPLDVSVNQGAHSTGKPIFSSSFANCVGMVLGSSGGGAFAHFEPAIPNDQKEAQETFNWIRALFSKLAQTGVRPEDMTLVLFGNNSTKATARAKAIRDEILAALAKVQPEATVLDRLTNLSLASEAKLAVHIFAALFFPAENLLFLVPGRLSAPLQEIIGALSKPAITGGPAPVTWVMEDFFAGAPIDWDAAFPPAEPFDFPSSTATPSAQPAPSAPSFASSPSPVTVSSSRLDELLFAESSPDRGGVGVVIEESDEE